MEYQNMSYKDWKQVQKDQEKKEKDELFRVKDEGILEEMGSILYFEMIRVLKNVNDNNI